MSLPLITLLTDFGMRDHYVAAMKGVILSICPGAGLVDITHDTEPFGIAQAAWTLSQAWPCFPPGTTHLVVVDPGVGSERRPIAIEAAGHFFVGPDNGVLTSALASGHSPEVHHITASDYFRKPLSNTFHGRDIFAPCAAHLACGLAIPKLGPPISDAILLQESRPVWTGNGWSGTVTSVDRFGNIVTNFEAESFQWVVERPFQLKLPSQLITIYSPTYAQAPVGEYFLTVGSAGFLEISLNGASAGDFLQIRPGIPLFISKK